MTVIYNLGIRLYSILIYIASTYNRKARLWVNGRKNVWSKINSFDSGSDKTYWFHCASLGEFEQGRPLIEALKEKEDCKIVVSFFSPSGYEVRKNYKHADLVFYLPIDTQKNARKLVEIIKPDHVFFIKYEFWANYIFELKNRGIQVSLVSGLFRDGQIFFKKRGFFFRKILAKFDHVFVQNEKSIALLKSINIHSVLTGDTRFDRVMANAENSEQVSKVEIFLEGEEAFVVGSSWPEDESRYLPLINEESFTGKVIVAPHEIDDTRIGQLKDSISKTSIRFSELDHNSSKYQVLIIDNIGLLMHIYQYAKLAYIGGGFKTGLHNILEPACFGVPVVFGDKHNKFPEARLFIDHGIGFEISTDSDLKQLFYSLDKNNLKDKIIQFMNSQTGATEIILKTI